MSGHGTILVRPEGSFPRKGILDDAQALPQPDQTSLDETGVSRLPRGHLLDGGYSSAMCDSPFRPSTPEVQIPTICRLSRRTRSERLRGIHSHRDIFQIRLTGLRFAAPAVLSPCDDVRG